MKDPTQTRRIIDGIERIEGRVRQFSHYVEFDPMKSNRVTFVAQKATENWNVYEVHPGKKGTVKMLASYRTKRSAVALAFKLAKG